MKADAVGKYLEYPDVQWSAPEIGQDGLERWGGKTKEWWLKCIPYNIIDESTRSNGAKNLWAFAILSNGARKPLVQARDKKYADGRPREIVPAPSIKAQINKITDVVGFEVCVRSSMADDNEGLDFKIPL